MCTTFYSVLVLVMIKEILLSGTFTVAHLLQGVHLILAWIGRFIGLLIISLLSGTFTFDIVAVAIPMTICYLLNSRACILVLVTLGLQWFVIFKLL